MNILFLHRNFPAQFRHLAQYFAKDPNNKVIFITEQKNWDIPGVIKAVYKTKRTVPKNAHRYLSFYEDSIIHGQTAASVAIDLKKKGFVPDIIYGHTWGPTLFMKEVFPKTPLICYFEWFYNYENSDVDFDRQTPLNEDDKARIKIKNSHILIDLINCDSGTAPTQWQKKQFPKEFHHKIDVMHDGIDADYFKPEKDARLILTESNIELTQKDEVITYATRGMEPYRGFPQFMKAAEIILKNRPKAQIVIAGQDKVCYGAQRQDGKTYKQLMLENLDLDLSRVHFTGLLPYPEYLSLLRISKAHVYLTYPFVLSWSLLEAMSTGCCVIASDTEPVREVIKNGENGLLVDFFSPEAIAQTINDVLKNQEKVQGIRYQARKTIIKNYDLKNMLQQQINLMRALAKVKAEK